MNTYIALFRGINVGGHNRLLMNDLRSLLGDLGYQNVDTYIQTGNVVFQTEKNNIREISKDIRAEVKNNHGFEPDVLLLTLEEIKDVIESNPFPEAKSDPKSLHLNFLISTPENPDLESLENFKKESERFKLTDKIFYLHAPDGIGRSKLAGKTEKLLGVSMTGRNWRTVQRILQMAEAGG